MEMDRYWLTFWLIAAVLLSIMWITGHIYTNKYEEMMTERYNKCIEVGGSWVPTNKLDAVCLRK